MAAWEPLLSHCPECGKELGWERCRGITVCDHCLDDAERPLVDLREFAQPFIQAEDREAPRFATDLVSHDPEVRAEAAAKADADWRELNIGELFQGIVAIATSVSQDQALIDSCGKDCPEKSTPSQPGLQPADLAMVARVVLEGGQAFGNIWTCVAWPFPRFPRTERGSRISVISFIARTILPCPIRAGQFCGPQSPTISSGKQSNSVAAWMAR